MSGTAEAPGVALLRILTAVRARAAGRPQPDQLMADVVRAADALAARATDVARLGLPAVGLARLDAQQFADALDAIGPGDPQDDLVDHLALRFVEQARRVADSADALQRRPTRDDDDGPEHSMAAQAEAYGDDAQEELHAARDRRTSAALVLLVAVGAAAWAARVADHAYGSAWPHVLPPLVVCVAGSLSGVMLVRAAASHDRAARECRRLQRGLAGLGPYLAPLPAPARHLLRATMAQTLFPRLLDDDDPLRQPEWPPARDLLYAVYGVAPPGDDGDDATGAQEPESSPPTPPGPPVPA